MRAGPLAAHPNAAKAVGRQVRGFDEAVWLAAGDSRAAEPARWRGRNLLGFALMEARRRLVDGGR